MIPFAYHIAHRGKRVYFCRFFLPATHRHLNKNTLINDLIDEYKECTSGGRAVSKTALSNKINHLIKKEWEEKDRKMIQWPGHSRSNIKTVSNKTDSCIAAEFSLRSTLSYLMVVLSTHYINAEPTSHCYEVRKLHIYYISCRILMNKQHIFLLNVCGTQ